jgi:hypothetical protein
VFHGSDFRHNLIVPLVRTIDVGDGCRRDSLLLAIKIKIAE